MNDNDLKIENGRYIETQGRCHECNIRFIWPARKPALKAALCPICRTQLKQTTYLFKGFTLHRTPIIKGIGK